MGNRIAARPQNSTFLGGILGQTRKQLRTHQIAEVDSLSLSQANGLFACLFVHVLRHMSAHRNNLGRPRSPPNRGKNSARGVVLLAL